MNCMKVEITKKEMMMKVGKLTASALDWAVAKCEAWGKEAPPKDFTCCCGLYVEQNVNPQAIHMKDCIYAQKFSTDWSQGGPIIEREKIGLWPIDTGYFAEKKHFGKHHAAGRNYGEGPTPLIAAMRCYVASKLGEDIDVPKKLINGKVSKV
jgi:hypothetical protein